MTKGLLKIINKKYFNEFDLIKNKDQYKFPENINK